MESKRIFFAPFDNGNIYIPADIVEEFKWNSLSGHWEVVCSNGKAYASNRCLDEMEQDMGISVKYVGKDAEDMKDDDDPGGIVW